jgi:predicted metal-dependent HD superfamily phosphohydrolase
MENTYIDGFNMQRVNKWNKACTYAGAYMERFTKNPYHNFSHAKDVAAAAAKICRKENVGNYDSFIVMSAAIFHDAVFKVGAEDNEEKSGRVAEHLLYRAGYTRPERDMITQLILATKMPVAPKNLLERVLCDADLDNLARPDFMEKGSLLRKERGVEDNNNWYSCQLRFLKSHSYHTDYQRKSTRDGVEKNIARLEQLLEVV